MDGWMVDGGVRVVWLEEERDGGSATFIFNRDGRRDVEIDM